MVYVSNRKVDYVLKFQTKLGPCVRLPLLASYQYLLVYFVYQLIKMSFTFHRTYLNIYIYMYVSFELKLSYISFILY